MELPSFAALTLTELFSYQVSMKIPRREIRQLRLKPQRVHRHRTGLVTIGQRYYDPGVGRWTQQDPKVQPFDPAQANRYSYASCNPVNNVDPSGVDHCTRGQTVAHGAVFVGGALVTIGSVYAAIATGGLQYL